LFWWLLLCIKKGRGEVNMDFKKSILPDSVVKFGL
jgi:hypothetical protein